ncbi:hypothetical protein C0J52_01245 [Blattella germanica]|nr:hypothetical protein C0J52_01245 [Blattella germanica]
MDCGSIGNRPSRARVRSHSHITRPCVADDKTVIKMKTDVTHRRYSDSEEKSTRPRILSGPEDISNLVRMHSSVLGQSAPSLSTSISE